MKALQQELSIRPFRDGDERAVVELLNASLGGGPAGIRPPEFFRWKHLANPFGRSFMLVAEADGRIIGLRAFMRWRFRAGEQMFTAVRAVDTATHPDFQGMGIFTRLTRQALEELRGEIDFVFNTPNEKSLPGYLKMGWRIVERVRPWVRVRRPAKVARGFRSLRTVDADREGTPPHLRAAPAGDILRDTEYVSALLQSADSTDAGLQTPRDVAYLQWRYATPPLLDYRAIHVGDGDSLHGLAIFRARPRGILWEATIVELIVRPADNRTASRLLRRVIHSGLVDHVTCLFPGRSNAARAARRHAFLPAPVGRTLVVNPLRDGLSPDPGRPESWALSLGDLEVF